MATAQIKVDYNRYQQNFAGWWSPYGGTQLFAGTTGGGSQYRTVLRLADFSAYALYPFNSVTLYLYRYEDGQGASKTWHYQIASGINVDAGTINLVAGTSGTFTFTQKNAWKAVTLSAAAVAALKAGNRYICLFNSEQGSYAGIRPLEYSGGAYAAYVVIDYTPEPKPMPPPWLSKPGTITTASNTFGWGEASDTVFPSSQLSYEMQVSYNGGTSWSATYTSAQGIGHYILNIKTALGLEDKQYYYNTNCKFRVRTKTPLYNGQHYYSSWVSSATFKIDYRIVPSAPTSLVPTKSDPYEGEIIGFTIGRPVSYNTHDSDGNIMSLIYWVYYGDGTALWGVTRSSTLDPIAFSTPELPNKTVGKADFSTTIRAHVIDMEGQTGPFGSAIPFTVKRFRNPIVSVVKVSRAPTEATVYIQIPDTGYGGSQSSAQIRKVQYNLGGAGWTDAILGSWSGLSNSFTLTGLDQNTRYALQVRVINVAPSGTALSDKTSSVYTATVNPYTPMGGFLRKLSTGVKYLFARSGIIGPDHTAAVGDGCLLVDKDLTAGGTIYADSNKKVWHEGNVGAGSGLDADTLDGKHLVEVGSSLEIAGGVATEAWYEFADLVITKQYGSGAGTFTLQSSGLRRFTAIIFVRLYQQNEMSATGLFPPYTTLHVTGMTGITSDDIRGILVTDTTTEKRMRFFVRLPEYARGTIFASGLSGDITPKAERVDALPSGIELAASVIDTNGVVATLNDDSVMTITPSRSYGALIILPRHPNYSYVWGGFAFRVTSNIFVSPMFASSTMAGATGALTGTTGADGKVTISAHTDGKLYIENRCGYAISICYILMGS